MSELLIRVLDKVNRDHPHLDVQCMKRGEVVMVCPDGWGWSEAEKTAPYWRIIRVPGLPLDEAQALMAAERGDRLSNRMLQRRAFRLNLDQLPNNVASADEIRAAKIAKPALDDPFVIGDDGKVIG